MAHSSDSRAIVDAARAVTTRLDPDRPSIAVLMLRKLTKSVDVTTAHDEHMAGAVLLDVRTKQELKEVRISDAVHVPMTGLDQRSRALQRKYEGKKVLVICRSGNRSARAAAHLRSLGLDAWNVRGGIKAWQRKGLPVIGS